MRKQHESQQGQKKRTFFVSDSDIKVSILCATYNHVQYITQAIEGFLMQETKFPFEIIIHDDASTDGTAEIVRSYQERYPDVMHVILQDENQYSKGRSITRDIMLPMARGEYFALCEGDDYWTSPLKLQKQYDAMSRHPEVDICAHAFETRLAADESLLGVNRFSRSECVVPIEDVIVGEGGFFGTNTLMFRKSLFVEIPKFVQNLTYDYTLQIMGALRGGALYLPENMSVYHFAVPGSWCSRQRSDGDMQAAFLEQKISMLEEFNRYTDSAYLDAVKARLLLYKVSEDQSAASNREVLELYRSGFGFLNRKDKVAIMLKCYMPFILKVKHRLLKTKQQKAVEKAG